MRKLNLHFTIDDAAQEYCRKVNALIDATSRSEIRFEAPWNMVPHVSIVMGYLAPGATVGKIEALMRGLASGNRAGRAECREPYLEDVRGRYVMMDVTLPDHLALLSAEASRQATPTFLLTESGSSKVPHLTVAHITENESAVREILRSLPRLKHLVCSGLELSDVGARGSCVNSLAAVHLEG